MAEQRIGRRDVLVGAGAGAVGVLVAMGTVAAPTIASAGAPAAAPGSFFVTVSPKGGPPFRLVIGLAEGGVATTIDSQSPGDVDLGSWEWTATGKVDIKLIQFVFDNSGNNLGYLAIEPKATISGESISGTYDLTFFPVTGPSQPSGSGTFTGKSLL